MLFEDEHNRLTSSRHGTIRLEHNNGVQRWISYIPKCGKSEVIRKNGMPYCVVISYKGRKRRTWLIPLSNPLDGSAFAVGSLFSGHFLCD